MNLLEMSWVFKFTSEPNPVSLRKQEGRWAHRNTGCVEIQKQRQWACFQAHGFSAYKNNWSCLSWKERWCNLCVLLSLSTHPPAFKAWKSAYCQSMACLLPKSVASRRERIRSCGFPDMSSAYSSKPFSHSNGIPNLI